jgi:hypothetical protein
MSDTTTGVPKCVASATTNVAVPRERRKRTVSAITAAKSKT